MSADIKLTWEWPNNRTPDTKYFIKILTLTHPFRFIKSPSIANYLPDPVLINAVLLNADLSTSTKTLELCLPKAELMNLQPQDIAELDMLAPNICIAVSKVKSASEKIGGWKVKSSSIAYENPWIKVMHDQVITPKGTDGIYGVVHFKNTAIGIVPIDEEGNTWLVKQSRYTLNQYTWEILEGGCPEGEDPINAARRELEEEVGLQAADLTELMRMHLSNSVSDELAIVFVAKGLSAGQQALEPTEDIEYKKVPLTEAINMVKRGEITDSISVAALLRIACEN